MQAITLSKQTIEKDKETTSFYFTLWRFITNEIRILAELNRNRARGNSSRKDRLVLSNRGLSL